MVTQLIHFYFVIFVVTNFFLFKIKKKINLLLSHLYLILIIIIINIKNNFFRV